MTAIGFAILAVGLTWSPAPSEATSSARPIIDMHLHAVPVGGWAGVGFCPGDQDKHFPPIDPRESFTASDLETCAAPLVAPASDEENLKRTLEALERHNIRAYTSGYLDLVEKWKAADPVRIVPSYAVSRPQGEDVGELRELITSGRVAALGEVWTQNAGMSPSDPVMEPILALAEELDVPVGIHMGMGVPGGAYLGRSAFRARLTSPLLLEEALLRHPKLRVFVMHAGWPMGDDMIHMLYSHPQLYVDISVINWYLPRAEFHAYLERLVRAGMGKRIMFGSDQVVWPETIQMAIDSINSASFLREEQKDDIFFNNAARFLRMSERR
jgi:predicted TIM-barrel fold metal-dependent hydrolase